MALARWLETDSLSNQNISSALAIGAYTAAADRMIVCDVSLDQVAGGGDYVIYITRQIAGAGSAYVMLPKTTCTAAAGETAIAMQSGPITVRSGDVLTVYVDGLAGDTTTPDTVVRWFEQATLRSDVADRQLTVAATGEASANVTLWRGDTPADLDASGNVPTVLADAAHGGSSATLALKSVTVTNNDMGGKAVALTADATTGTGLSISGWKAIDAAGGSGGDFVGNLTGTVDEVGALNSNAQQNVADALKSAPTAGDPTPGSVYAYLAAAEPADIWSYVTRTLTQSSTSTTDSTTAGSISRRRGDSWSISLTLGAITGYTSLWFTVKAATSDADTAAIFQIKKNASGSGDGLLYVNGATASSAALGSITVLDATTGAVIIALDETITDDLTPASYSYDCQALISGSVSTPDSGTFTITADVTRVVV